MIRSLDVKHTWTEAIGAVLEPLSPRVLHVTSSRSRFRDVSQLEKVYTEDSEDSAVQMEEERMRMRNHVLAEVRSVCV